MNLYFVKDEPMDQLTKGANDIKSCVLTSLYGSMLVGNLAVKSNNKIFMCLQHLKKNPQLVFWADPKRRPTPTPCARSSCLRSIQMQTTMATWLTGLWRRTANLKEITRKGCRAADPKVRDGMVKDTLESRRKTPCCRTKKDFEEI